MTFWRGKNNTSCILWRHALWRQPAVDKRFPKPALYQYHPSPKLCPNWMWSPSRWRKINTAPAPPAKQHVVFDWSQNIETTFRLGVFWQLTFSSKWLVSSWSLSGVTSRGRSNSRSKACPVSDFRRVKTLLVSADSLASMSMLLVCCQHVLLLHAAGPGRPCSRLRKCWIAGAGEEGVENTLIAAPSHVGMWS